MASGDAIPVDDVLRKVVLSTLVGKKVALTKAGREYKGLCPFHDEKTPSFYVNDDKGFFHCFGCSAHGDAVKWMMDIDSLSRPDAIAFLAKSVGITPKKGGGKLNRSETVTVRLDPKLNYLCELASRLQRRTKSSFIEWAVAEALGSVHLSDELDGEAQFYQSIKHASHKLWHVDEADRLVSLAIIAPSLLTHDEQLIWRLVRENGFLWRGRYNPQREWCWDISEDNIIRDRLRANWETLKAVAAGEESASKLPTWSRHRDDGPDDLPF